MPITLRPDKYPCPIHQQNDLTDQVIALLGGETIPVAGYNVLNYDPGRVTNAPFLVIASCPGTDQDKPHDQPCSGTYSTT